MNEEGMSAQLVGVTAPVAIEAAVEGLLAVLGRSDAVRQPLSRLERPAAADAEQRVGGQRCVADQRQARRGEQAQSFERRDRRGPNQIRADALEDQRVRLLLDQRHPSAGARQQDGGRATGEARSDDSDVVIADFELDTRISPDKSCPS